MTGSLSAAFGALQSDLSWLLLGRVFSALFSRGAVAVGLHRRSVLAFSAMLFLLLLLPACFGGGGEFGLMEFEDVPPSEESPELVSQEELGSFAVSTFVLQELNYLYTHQVWLETLRRLNRDLSELSSGHSGTGGSLDWVISVHEVIREADALFNIFSALEIPEAQRPAHQSLFLDGLEAVEVMAYGSDRLLAAALVLGPSGRTAADLSMSDRTKYYSLTRESAFFLRDSGRLIDQQIKNVTATLGRVGLR